MFTCLKCKKSFTRKDNLIRHERTACKNKNIDTNVIEQPMKKRKTDSSKVSEDKDEALQKCEICNIFIAKGNFYVHCRTLQHKNNSCTPYSDGVCLVRSSFKCRIASYRITSKNLHNDYKTFFYEVKQKCVLLLQENIGKYTSMKINMELFATFLHPSKEILAQKSFNTSNEIVCMASDMHNIYELFMDKIISQASEFQERDSGWALQHITHLEVNINKFSPMGGTSYIKLPKSIESKHAVVNVKNQDNACFAWAITSALYPALQKSDRVSSYPHYSTVLDLTGIDMPVKLGDISRFEQNNNISINVYGLETKFEDKKIYYEVVGPLRYSNKKLDRHVNLLFISEDCKVKEENHECSNNCNRTHYCWIKDLSNLVSSQISMHNGKLYFCDGCLVYFDKAEGLIFHKKYDCGQVYAQTPSTDLKIDRFGRTIQENILKFESYQKQLTVPFVVYADFESILQPMAGCEPDPSESFTVKNIMHKPYSFAYVIKCSFDDNLTKFKLFRGSNAAEEFVSCIERDLRELYNTHLRDIVPMTPLTADERKIIESTKNCGICEKPFQLFDKKVTDHCHITGKKRFLATHSTCNLQHQLPNFVPIIFHNLSGYDCHMFIKELCRHGDNIDVIAENKEKYISFTKSIYVHDYVNRKGETIKKYLRLRFIDSYKFLAASLDELSKGLDSDSFIQTRKHFKSEEEFNLMRQKGVFPYGFVTDLSKLDVPNLPSKSQFYDDLKEQHITDLEYERGKKVWDLFHCQTLGDYSDLYLKTDVLILSDIFETFRRNSLTTYKLDPAQYYTLPSLSFDCMLRMTEVELELLTEIDMVHFFKKGIRGGVSQCVDRMHVANNKYLPNYDPNVESSFIMYLDATNLYGHSMSQPLPTKGFKWLSREEMLNLNIHSVPDDSPIGYVLEVDVYYPNELHEIHSDFPFLVENIIPPDSKSKSSKLIPNLYDKIRYVVHYTTLNQAVNNGLMVIQTHRILKFEQSPWLKKYIDTNTKLRNSADTKFKKDLYKLFNNAVFGKTMENVENYKDIKLVTSWESIRRKAGARALISRPNFNSCSIFTDELTAIHMNKLKIVYNKPIYLGFCILDLSKTVLYDFFYNVIKKEFNNRASLMYTDTDSLVLKIYTDDFYKFILENPEKFDTSNYNEVNKFNIIKNKSVLGRMKDEFPEDPIISFYGTGAKAYYINSLSTEVKKAKGVKKSVIDKHLSIHDYKKVVEAGGCLFRKMKAFKTDLHNVYTETRNKISLSHHDDKRFVIPNSTHTLPWGHPHIRSYEK